MKILNLFMAILLLTSTNLFAQTKIRNLEPKDYMNFWIGSWDLTWKSTNGIGIGTNTIKKIMNDNVIEENFNVLNDSSMIGFAGKSWSVYNKINGTWYQTWVDNQGAYLDFIGEFKDNKRIFKRTVEKPNGNVVMQRMVFYNITNDSFTWDWESSTDNGKNWKLLWRINYKRKLINN